MNGWPASQGGRSSAQQAASSGGRSSVQQAGSGRSSVQQAGTSVIDAEGREVRQGAVPEPVQKRTMPVQPSVPPHPVLVPTLRPEGVGFSQGVVPEPVQKGTMPVQPSVLPPSVQPSVLPPSVLVPTLRQCEARDSKAEQFAGRLLESRRDPTRQEICALFGLLPCDSPSAPASSNLAAVCSFRTGMISREGIPLLADACHEYPLTTEIMTSFVRAVMPGHRFTTVVIYCNVSTKMHRDTDNESTTSGVVALSRFEGGEIWVESPEGEVTQMVEGSLVRGKLLHVGSRPVFLDAHKDMRRVVLAAFCCQGFEDLCDCEAWSLRALGFKASGEDRDVPCGSGDSSALEDNEGTLDEEGSERVEKFRSEDCGNSGPPLSLEWDGQLEPVSDGFGLCSPTRWPPEARR